jgi:hypothetical protein
VANGDIARFRLIFVGTSVFGARICLSTFEAWMNTVSRSIFAGAALAVLLAGCQKSDAPAATSTGALSQPVADAAPIPQMPTGVPDAATTFAQDGAGKTKAMQDTTALQQKPAPQEKMTKAEESQAMPLPGQANDHSTTALDKNKGG